MLVKYILSNSAILICQRCRTPITPQTDEKGQQVLEFYGAWDKWNDQQEHLIVCQNCLYK